MSVSGTTDSPVAYGFGYYELEPLFGQPGWRRANLYDPLQEAERDVEAAIRFHRHTAESILNTPGTGLNNAERNLAPWLTMPLSDTADDVDGQFEEAFTSRENTRALMAMFRGKNIKEAMFWTEWYIRATDNPPPPPADQTTRTESIAALLEAWTQTQRSVVEVYSTRVKKYARTWAQTGTPPVVYEDATETAEEKASRLEFTLREFPQTPRSEREVRINSRQIPMVFGSTDPRPYQTTLSVDFDWIDLAYAGTPPSYADARMKAEINIECSIEFTGDVGRVPNADDFGRVQIWSGATSQYVTIKSYTFNAPVSSDDNRWRMRLQAVVDPENYNENVSYQYVFPDPTAGNAPRTRLRLIQQSPVPFQTRYDLVQFIPTDEEYPPASEGAMAMANSDMNHDGVVDPTDLSIYLDEWMMDSPAADFDSDTAVTGEDADAFVEAYVNGT
jgi:hypothetical protein